MKILLVAAAPSSQSFGISALFVAEPLALEYIGAGVRGDHEVKILDLRINTEPGLKETLESFQPDIIGCGPYTLEVNPVKKIFSEAKKIHPGILTVVGGIHASVMPADFFADMVDVVVIGEGIGPFRKICDYHEKRKSFADIENIYYRQNGEFIFTRTAPYPDLDSLPFPDRTLTAHLRSKYQTILTEKLIPWASIRGSVGCYYRCKFCSVSVMMKQKLYTRSIDNIIQELRTINEDYLFWVDDELLIDPERTVELARAIQNSGIKKRYFCCGRSDTIVRHPEVIEEWAKAGLDYIFIGLEGFRDKDLKEMKKATNVSRNDQSIEICHKFGVKVRGSFMIMPDFNKKDFKNMGKYIRKLGVDTLSLTVYTPVPGTELWEEKKAEVITGNYDHFDYAHPVLPTKLPFAQFYKEYFKMVNRVFPLRRKIKMLIGMSPELRKKYIKNFKTVKKGFEELGRNYVPVKKNADFSMGKI